jgi:iron complex outermembrane receptor protein
VGYSPQRINDSFAAYTVQTTVLDYEHTTPRHIGNAHLGWAGGRWEIDSYLHLQSSSYSVRGNSALFTGATLARIPGYASADARAAYRMSKHSTLALSGQNLLHDQQIQTASAAVERRVLLMLSVDY